MSEVNLNDRVRQVVRDSEVITVPIDTTLTVSGEAADAKAVGDALALKADKSELQTQVNVNGQAPDNQGTILVRAEHIPMGEEPGAQSVQEAVEDLQEMDASGLMMDRTAQTPVSVKEAVEELQERTGEDIMLTGEQEDGTIAAAVAGLREDFNDEEIRQMLADAGYEEATT